MARIYVDAYEAGVSFLVFTHNCVGHPAIGRLIGIYMY